MGTEEMLRAGALGKGGDFCREVPYLQLPELTPGGTALLRSQASSPTRRDQSTHWISWVGLRVCFWEGLVMWHIRTSWARYGSRVSVREICGWKSKSPAWMGREAGGMEEGLLYEGRAGGWVTPQLLGSLSTVTFQGPGFPSTLPEERHKA